MVGGSLGGMQVLQWTMAYPERIANAVVIAATPRLSAQNIAFNEVARQAIRSDPDFHDGWYTEHGTVPKRGLKLARMIGHITYLSEHSMGAKFGRDLRTDQLNFGYDVEFQVESSAPSRRYVLHQFRCQYLSADDQGTGLFRPGRRSRWRPRRGAGTRCPFLVISFTTIGVSRRRARELVEALMRADKAVSYASIDSPMGMMPFCSRTRYEAVFGGFMRRVARDFMLDCLMRADLKLIHDWVPQGARVLDLGCGDGLARRAGARQAGHRLRPGDRPRGHYRLHRAGGERHRTGYRRRAEQCRRRCLATW